MRDAQSKLDQVIAFTGKTINDEDVATVLGLVGRDLLLDALEAVSDEDAPAAFALAGRAVEMGYDLRAVCRELSRVVRDLLVISIDPSRISDPEIAGEGERERLTALVARFSREDLLRAFDLLTRAEAEIRAAAQPRYHLEMALLRWIHLRKLAPIEELIATAESGSVAPGPARVPQAARPVAPVPSASNRPSQPAPAGPSIAASSVASGMKSSAASGSSLTAETVSSATGSFKDAMLAEIRKSKAVFYNTVVAQAQRIEVTEGRVTFFFSPAQRTLRDMVEQNRGWLESLAQAVSGRQIVVAGVQAEASSVEHVAEGGTKAATDKKSALREQALADAGVQALLEVFPAEIRDVEEM